MGSSLPSIAFPSSPIDTMVAVGLELILRRSTKIEVKF